MLALAGLLIGLASAVFKFNASSSEDRILVFSKTEGYRHTESIREGQKAFFQLAAEHNVTVDTTENAGVFTDANLKRYRAIVLLNISGAVFNEEQRVSLKRYVQAGGGVLSIHATADAERDWPWFNGLVGAYFHTHPPVQKGRFTVVNKQHPATEFMPDTLTRTDEFYNFESVRPNLNILVTLDEATYTGGKMGANHPMVWHQEYDGGRSFYTAWGHTKANWQEPFFLKQLWGGLYWVMGENNPKPLNYAKSIPEDNRFIRHELMTNMDEPMQMAILRNGNVFVAQRRGTILLYDAATKTTKPIGTIPVLSAYEDGLLGIAADPNFERNGFLYAFYAEAAAKDSVSDYHISRFTVGKNGLLNLQSEKVLLAIPHKNADGIHTGGGLLFDPRGTGDLFITVGDNTSPRATLYAPLDERPGRELFNAQRTAANTADLRGKILRIHPQPNGTYTIPNGNLFPKGTAKTRPEIYSMGHRQPWRLSMDTQTGWLYEGEVGPDASVDSVNRGPMAYDEFNQIRKPGNFGWPYFGGNNRPYYQYDFATGKTGAPFDPKHLVNTSRLNTGLRDLPPAQGAMIWYSASIPNEFPLLGRGARSAMGGPIFRRADFKPGSHPFPAYYEGKWFITEWLRNWIMVVSMDDNGNYTSMEPFLPNMSLAGPMDMQFGPDGGLYVLEYGKGWFRQNNDSKLIRLEYNPGNRAPVPVITVDRDHGRVPFTVNLSPKGTRDFDGDSLTYSWKIVSSAGHVDTFKTPNTSVRLDKVGVYTATLTVTDAKGSTASESVRLYAGNEAPNVNLAITGGNKTFFFPNAELAYTVNVVDAEDGSLASGTIPSSRVTVSMNYVPDGFTIAPKGQTIVPQNGLAIKGGMIINANDCYHCHSINQKLVGPTFTEIAQRYKDDDQAEDRLSKKVISGGGGSWGNIAMSAHPELPLDDAKRMIRFILNLAQPAPKSLPVAGTHTIKLPARLSAKGVYVLAASYTDKGANGLPPATDEKAIVLRAPWLLPSQASFRKSGMNIKIPSPKGEVELLQGKGAYIGYRQIDLTNIRQLELTGAGTDILEVHIDSPDGRLLGHTQPTADGQESEQTIPLESVSDRHDLYFVVKSRGYSIKNMIKFISL
ncbi:MULTISPECIES: ThuA domain-containing protein [unclassified Spirosoma]|uniref:ThuA domain-containing protein n=1 Tax=unclassified Spirosoma TaxID=2621999 RepID=UPI000AC5D04F|nr:MULTISPECIES: ThuA domain-containing protein [unclassified Spirosoma]MBN8825692.1 ThuA domain-containing protein [Spirosoma sp.]